MMLGVAIADMTWGAPDAMSLLAAARAGVATKSAAGCSSTGLIGCSLGGPAITSRFAVTERVGDGDVSPARTAALARVTIKKRAAARHGLFDFSRVACVRSCRGVTGCSCN